MAPQLTTEELRLQYNPAAVNLERRCAMKLGIQGIREWYERKREMYNHPTYHISLEDKDEEDRTIMELEALLEKIKEIL